jgi:formyl-CoA transferase
MATDSVVPLYVSGGNLKFTISSPLQVHDVAKVPARRAPELGEHSEEILKQLGFNTKDIESLRTSGAVPRARARAA